MPNLTALPILLALAGTPAPLLADAAGDAAGDSTRGAVLAATCSGCHRDTVAAGGIPSLRGLRASDIADKLRAYRSGELEGTLMNRLARGYSDREIDLLAATLGAPAE